MNIFDKIKDDVPGIGEALVCIGCLFTIFLMFFTVLYLVIK